MKSTSQDPGLSYNSNRNNLSSAPLATLLQVGNDRKTLFVYCQILMERLEAHVGAVSRAFELDCKLEFQVLFGFVKVSEHKH